MEQEFVSNIKWNEEKYVANKILSFWNSFNAKFYKLLKKIDKTFKNFCFVLRDQDSGNKNLNEIGDTTKDKTRPELDIKTSHNFIILISCPNIKANKNEHTQNYHNVNENKNVFF